MELYPYQVEAVKAVTYDIMLRDNALCVLPTGCGKTEIIFEFCKQNVDKRILIVSHKVNLVEQTFKRALLQVDDVGIYCGSLDQYSTEKSLTIASVQSINKIDAKFDFIIVDECHRIPARHIQSHYSKLLAGQRIIGFTATPFRSSGYIYGTDTSWFVAPSYEKTIKEMIDAGYLVRPRLKKVENEFNTSRLRIIAGDYSNRDLNELVSDEDKVRAQVKDALTRLEGRKKVVWACTNIKHCELVARILSETDTAIAIHSKKNNEDIFLFESGPVRNLTFVTIISEGYNYPPIDALVFMRPTRSPVLYVQTVGRAIRTSPGKTDALVLDYGQVIKTLGPIDCLDIGHLKERRAKKVISTGKFCEKCYDFNEPKALECSGCGAEFPRPDPLKNLTTRHDADVSILSTPPVEEWVDIRTVTLKNQRSMSGRAMIVVTYYPLSGTKLPMKEYLVKGDGSEWWMTAKSLNKLERLRVQGVSDQLFNNCNKIISSIKRIKVRKTGKFPEIKDIEHDI